MINAVLDGFEHDSMIPGPSCPAVCCPSCKASATHDLSDARSIAPSVLNSMRSVLEALVYAGWLFLVPMLMLPIGCICCYSVGYSYRAPMYAILNYISTIAASSKSLAAMSLSRSEGVTIASSLGLVEANVGSSVDGRLFSNEYSIHLCSDVQRDQWLFSNVY